MRDLRSHIVNVIVVVNQALVILFKKFVDFYFGAATSLAHSRLLFAFCHFARIAHFSQIKHFNFDFNLSLSFFSLLCFQSSRNGRGVFRGEIFSVWMRSPEIHTPGKKEPNKQNEKRRNSKLAHGICNDDGTMILYGLRCYSRGFMSSVAFSAAAVLLLLLRFLLINIVVGGVGAAAVASQ